MVNLGRHSNSRAGNKGTPFYVAPVSTLYSQADIRRLGYALESSLQNDAGKPVDLFFCLVHPEAQDFKTGITSAAFPTLAGGGNNSVCVFAIDKDQELHKCGPGNTCLKGAPEFINVPGDSYDPKKWEVVSQIPFKWAKSNSRWYQNQPWSPLLEGTSSEKNLYHVSQRTPDFKYLYTLPGFEALEGLEALNTLIPPVQWKQFYGPENFMNDPRSLVLNGGAGEGRGGMPSWMPLPVAGGNKRGEGESFPCFRALEVLGQWEFSMFKTKIFDDECESCGAELDPNQGEETDCIWMRLRYWVSYKCVCGGAPGWGTRCQAAYNGANGCPPGVWNTWETDGPIFPPGGKPPGATTQGFAFTAFDFVDTGKECHCWVEPVWNVHRCTCHSEHQHEWKADRNRQWNKGSYTNPISHGGVYIQGNTGPTGGKLRLDLNNHGKDSILWKRLVGGPGGPNDGCWANSKLKPGVIGDYDTWKCVLGKIKDWGGVDKQLKKEFMTALCEEVMNHEPYKFFEHFWQDHPQPGVGCAEQGPDRLSEGYPPGSGLPPGLPGPQPPPVGTYWLEEPPPGGGGNWGLNAWKCVKRPPVPCPRKEGAIGNLGSSAFIERKCVKLSDLDDLINIGWVDEAGPGGGEYESEEACVRDCVNSPCDR